MGEQFDRAVSLQELTKAVRQCAKGVSWKDGVCSASLHAMTFAKRLRDDLLHGRYKLRKGTLVQIYRPKRREALAPWFRDRVWQRSICNNGVYDDLTRDLLPESFACQKGKGTDQAIRCVIQMLQRLHRERPGAPIYGVHLDIKKYFPSTPHSEIKRRDEQIITEPLFLPYLSEIVDSYDDHRTEAEITADPFGKRGTGLGSQINQLHQISLLNDLDHELKQLCRDTARYNDDILMLSHNREIVEIGRGITEARLAEKGLIMTDKSGVFKAQNGFYFLRKRFLITDTGKIVIRLHKKAMSEERYLLRCFSEAVKSGERTMQDVQKHYQSWIAQAEYCGDAAIREMDKYYTGLFRQRPQYKRKRRYLYGKPVKKSKAYQPGPGVGKRTASHEP